MQIEGIGPVRTKKLLRIGVQSLKQLAELNPQTIEKTLNRNTPFGDQLLQTMSDSIPKIVASVEQLHEQPTDGKIQRLSFRVHISLAAWKPKSSTSRTPSNGGNEVLRHKGFLLVGSHGKAVEYYASFELAEDSNSSDVFDVSVSTGGGKQASERWVDFLAGPDNFVGADFHHRVHINPMGCNTREPQIEPAQPHDAHPPKREFPNAQAGARKGEAITRMIDDLDVVDEEDSFLDLTMECNSPSPPPKAKALRRRPPSPSPGELLQKAWPFTSSLPVKRLRDGTSSSVAKCPFEGTRLSAFMEPAPKTVSIPDEEKGEEKDLEIDEYTAIFELLAREMDGDLGVGCGDTGTDDGLIEGGTEAGNRAVPRVPVPKKVPSKAKDYDCDFRHAFQ